MHKLLTKRPLLAQKSRERFGLSDLISANS